MKNLSTFLSGALSGALLTSLIIGIQLSNQEQNKTTTSLNQPTIIWNDDIESIPTDNSPIMLQFISSDTIYIGPIEQGL